MISSIKRLQMELFMLCFLVNNSGVIYFHALVTIFLTHSPSFQAAFLGALWLSSTGLSPEHSCQAQYSSWLRLIPELAVSLNNLVLFSSCTKHLQRCYLCHHQPTPTATPTVSFLMDKTANSSPCSSLRVTDPALWCIYWMALKGARKMTVELDFLLNFVLMELYKIYLGNIFCFLASFFLPHRSHVRTTSV